MEFYYIFKEKIKRILAKVFHRIETKVTLSNLFHEATVTLLSKPQKVQRKKIMK